MWIKLAIRLLGIFAMAFPAVDAQGEMVKMCLFYETPSGHARSDPIINQECPSDHVHTFYGPMDFHPNTSYEDLLKFISTPELSTSPAVENQSLYWHPSIYQVADNGDGTETYTRVSNLESSPYYRWDKSAPLPMVEAFPPGFRMIAGSSDPGANQGSETGSNMFTECCNLDGDEEEDCESWSGLNFPSRSCDFVGIALAMPTCWNGELGDTNDHKDHMAFTEDGTVAGPCPTGYNRRLPQVQLFVRIINYRGDLYRYQLSDGNVDVWHVDFFNGWAENKLQEIIDGCQFQPGQAIDEYNPPCDCAFTQEHDQGFLTINGNVPQPVCDSDVRRLIVDEATDVFTGPSGTDILPSGTCEEALLIPKSWSEVTSSLFLCEGGPTVPAPVPAPAPVPVGPTGPTEEGPEEEEEEEEEEGSEEGGGSSDGEMPSMCFSAFNSVDVEGKGLVTMDKLEIGDLVRGGKGYSRVHGFYHMQPSVETVFLQIATSNANVKPLEITEKHLVFVNGNSQPASAVSVGDDLSGFIVTSVKKVKRRGVYSPATFSGDIVVSGVRVSTYSSHLPHSPIDEHTAAHLLLSYHRILCHGMFSVCESETYSESGISHFIAPLEPLSQIGESRAFVQVVVVVLAFPLVAVVWMAEQLFLSSFLVFFFAFAMGIFLCNELGNRHSKATGINSSDTGKLKST